MNKEHRNTLVSGFIHKYKPINIIPAELLNLCYGFYNDVVDWTFDYKEYKEFGEYSSGDKLDGPKFIAKGIKFCLEIYPNGFKEKEKGYVIFCIRCLDNKLLQSIAHFTFYIILLCHEIKIECRNT